MRSATRSYKERLLRDLSDPKEAAAYLNAALEDGSRAVFLLALRDVAEARGMSKLAKKTTLNRVSMYRMLSRAGNPQLSSLATLLENLGLSLTVRVKKQAHAA